MHLEILNPDQVALLPLVATFKKEYYMVGGTAVALHIGHRISIDYDLFKTGPVKPKAILKKFIDFKEPYEVTLNMEGQLNLVCKGVKFTFLNYDFDVPHPVSIEKTITIPSLIDLAAMKAYALGRRSKWKDYLDLYFILRDHYTILDISQRAIEIYGDLFSPKLFCGQLSYFTGIDYTEFVEFIPGFEVEEQTIKDFLTNQALGAF